MNLDLPEHIERVRVTRDTEPVEIRIWIDDTSVEEAALDMAAEFALGPDEAQKQAHWIGSDIATKAASKLLGTVIEAYDPSVECVATVESEYEVRL